MLPEPLDVARGAKRTSRTMLITGVQKVDPASPALIKARASRPIRLPVAPHRERLNEQLVVMGSAVLEAPLCSAV